MTVAFSLRRPRLIHMTFDEYFHQVYNAKPEGQRVGQWAMNLLHSTGRHRMFVEITATEIDPWNNNKCLPEFLQHVRERWDDGIQSNSV